MALAVKRTTKWISILVIAAAVLLAGVAAILHVNRNTDPAHAAGPMTFELFATHPYASKSGYDNDSTNYYTGAELCPASSGQTFCPAGQTITDMEVTEDGELIAGYGDWNTNVDSFGVEEGRVGVVPLNLATGTWGDMFYAGSEAIDVIRKINGKIYVPTTDPSDKAATGNPHGNISGYITNETGDWSFVSNGSPSNEHTFDVATLNDTDRFTAGARPMGPGGDIANVRHSTDRGAQWVDSVNGANTSGYGRFYWAVTLNDRLYTAAWGDAMSRSFDGTTWQDEPNLLCPVNSGRWSMTTASFDGFIVCSGPSGQLRLFDGSESRDVRYNQYTNAQALDFRVADDGYLYVLWTSTGTPFLSRTQSLLSGTWEQISGYIPVNGNFKSIAVHDDAVYIGGDKGVIYKSSIPISEVTKTRFSSIPPDNTTCFDFEPGLNEITGYVHSREGCDHSDIAIPSEINGVEVRSIRSSALAYKSLTSVTIPDSIVSIGNNAFRGNQLTSIDIPDSVTSISHNAFSGNQLTEAVIPDWMTTIPSGLYSGNNIAEVSIPEHVTDIGFSAFEGNQLTSLIIPDSVTSIEVSAFRDNQLTSVTIPDSVASIGNGAFYGNQLTSVTIPNSVTSIGNYAFYENQLTSVAIPNSVTSIGVGAFSGSSGSNPLTNLTINIATIPGGIFNHRAIESLTLGDSVISINTDAFSYNQLTSVTIPDSVVSIGDRAFRDNQLTTLTIPNSVTSIGVAAFSNNRLTAVTIPSSVASIGHSAFSGAGDSNPLTNLTINIATIPGGIFNHRAIESLTLGESVISIADRAFQGNQLTSLTVPSSVTSIGDSAFNNNPLEAIYLHGEATLEANALGSPSAGSELAFMECIAAITPAPTDLADYIPCYEKSYPSGDSKFVPVYTPYPDFYADTLPEGFVRESLYAPILGVDPGIAGGYLFNPASVSIEYRDMIGNTIQQGRQATGEGLSDYSLQALFAAHPDVTDEDLATIYYRPGQTIALEAPAIPGFVTPPTFAMTLSEEPNTHTFIYLTQAQVDEGYTISPEGTVIAPNGEPFVPGAPNTGLPRIARNATGTALVLATAIAISFMGWRRISRSHSRS